MTTLTVGSLFTGIGGIDLGLERAGMRVIWQSEIDPYANKVLAKHWPEVPNLGDIKEIDFERVPRPDVLVGGYPCQPFSTAGKRQGENDPRHLWPECLRALRILRPRYALFENVRGHLSLGFSRVLADLASVGFNAEWQVIPAAAVGAPHRRDRVFIVAYPDSSHPTYGGQRENVPSQNSGWGNDRGRGKCDTGQECVEGAGETASCVAYADNTRGRAPKCGLERQGTQGCQEWDDAQHGPGRRSPNVADTAGGRQQKREPQPQTAHDISKSGSDVADPPGEQLGCDGSSAAVTRTGERRHNNRTGQIGDEFGQWWEVEPDVGRVANGVPFRVDRLRALGNAVVPQVAEYVGYLIAEHANA